MSQTRTMTRTTALPPGPLRIARFDDRRAHTILDARGNVLIRPGRIDGALIVWPGGLRMVESFGDLLALLDAARGLAEEVEREGLPDEDLPRAFPHLRATLALMDELEGMR